MRENSGLRRVAVTGMGAVSPLGRGVGPLMDGLYGGKGGVTEIPGLSEIGGLRCTVGASVRDVDPMEIPRKHRRSMSPMSIYAVLAAGEALEQAGISREIRESGRLGVTVGSTVGSVRTSHEFFTYFLAEKSIEEMKSSVFFKIMNHSCASNVAHALGITGRMMAVSAACSTGCQTVGYASELIAAGKQDFVLCGGADELHPLTVATFDSLRAASTAFNDRPDATPRPFDEERDGVVCGEGSGILLLESLDSALERGADILAEIAGFASVTDNSSIANPSADSMVTCMRLALDDASMSADDIGYVNAHATGTLQGDIAEGIAIERLFRDTVPVSSLKGHLGHTMAASGTLELIASIDMMRKGAVVPTRNLERADAACGAIAHASGKEKIGCDAAVKNSFALGGVNSSIVVRRCTE